MLRRIGFKPLGSYYTRPKITKTEAVMIQNPNYEKEVIEQAVEDMKLKEKEKKLLDVVAKQPDSDEKTKILEKKFKVNLSNEGKLDDFVPKTAERIANGIVYRYDCYFKQDKNISAQHRETDFMKKFGPFKDTALPEDEYYFYFPFSRELDDLAVLYKVDHMNVYIYDDGSVDTERSVKESIYQFFYDLQESKDFKSIRNKYRTLIRSLKIEEGNYLNFSIKGLGLRVNKKIIKRNIQEEIEQEIEQEQREEEAERKFDEFAQTVGFVSSKQQIVAALMDPTSDYLKDPYVAGEVAHIRKVITNKLKAKGKTIHIIGYENRVSGDPLNEPIIRDIDGDNYYVAVINKGFLRMSLDSMEKAIKENNQAMINGKDYEIKQNFQVKLNDLNKSIPDATFHF